MSEKIFSVKIASHHPGSAIRSTRLEEVGRSTRTGKKFRERRTEMPPL
jgi:hypothetical protein